MIVGSTRTEKLDLRLSPEAKQRLACAAAAERRSLSEFVLLSALDRADETLADRRTFQLAPAQWDEFTAALDAPPRDLPRMKTLLRNPGPFSENQSA